MVTRLDTLEVNLGGIMVEARGYCTKDGFELYDVFYEDVSVIKLLEVLEADYRLDFGAFLQMLDKECEDYIDRVYNPANQI